MKIMVGIPYTRGACVNAAVENCLDVLVSAGSMWVKKRGMFERPSRALFRTKSVALDSAGFVAMKVHGGYPWSIHQYCDLVQEPIKGMIEPWSWWSQMDFCCEPEIASNEAQVKERINATVESLSLCIDEAKKRGMRMPMPILQGWRPIDYELCVGLFDQILDGNWPPLVGVGSVCRRQLNGPNGLIPVINSISRLLPKSKLHLFGVKGLAIAHLGDNVESIDSCAWDFAARKDIQRYRREYMAQHIGTTMSDATKALPCTNALKARYMLKWHTSTQLQAKGGT